MALHDIREVRIPIELDKPRTLLFDLNEAGSAAAAR